MTIRDNFNRHPETGRATMLAPAEEIQCEHECEPGQCQYDRDITALSAWLVRDAKRQIDWVNLMVWGAIAAGVIGFWVWVAAVTVDWFK